MGTKTRKFGVSKRESHDSSRFYARKLYGHLDKEEKTADVENPLPPNVLEILEAGGLVPKLKRELAAKHPL